MSGNVTQRRRKMLIGHAVNELGVILGSNEYVLLDIDSLRLQRTNYKGLLSQARNHDVNFTLDGDGKIHMVNEQIINYMGFPRFYKGKLVNGYALILLGCIVTGAARQILGYRIYNLQERRVIDCYIEEDKVNTDKVRLWKYGFANAKWMQLTGQEYFYNEVLYPEFQV